MASEEPQATSSSVSAFISALVPTLIIAVVFLIIFILLRKKQKRVYEPRANVSTVPSSLKPDESPRGAFSWVSFIMHKPESFIIQQMGVDGYFFVRFLFGFSTICFLACCVTWPILFPVNATHGTGQSGFDILSYSNVGNKWKTFAHVFLSWIVFGGIIFFMYREFVYYTTFRHVLQTTPFYDSLLSTRTLLLTEMPESLYLEPELRNYFPTATNVWYGRDCSELTEKVKERTKLSGKYENALNGVLKKATKLRMKLQKKNKPLPEPEDDLNKYLKDGKKRPTHKLKFLIGEKVDTIDYGVERLGELNTEIKKDQLEYQSYTQFPSVFIEFPTQLEMQKAYQAIPYNSDLKKCKRYTGLAPDDIIWDNLSLTPMKRRIKKILASTFLTLMIIFWCIPVAVVGAISNINFLTDKVPFLRFINNMPDKLMGIITGLLPVVALAILMALVPVIIKKVGKVSGCITVQQVEGYCQAWFYAFQVVHVFFVVTVTSAAASSVTSIIEDPTSALSLLGERIPPASNFYISYFCLQGLTISAGVLVQIVALILAQFLGKLLDSTPRAKWNRYSTLKQPGWSVIYPQYQLLGSIGIIYSIIAPLVMGFACITFVLIYISYMYVLIYVFKPNVHDARGRNYPRALLQLFVGIYLAEICLIALFVFQENWACVALEAVCIAGSAVAHVWIKWKFLRLFDTVPISAIKYASGDTTFQYPMHDQGAKEIKIEGQNYWEGGNQLGLADKEHDDQVVPGINKPSDASTSKNGLGTNSSSSDAITGPSGANGVAANVVDSDDSVKHDDHSKFTHDSKAPINNRSSENVFAGDEEKDVGASGAGFPKVSPQAGGSWLKRFFKPKTESFDLIRGIMPDAYFNYIEYDPEFVKNAYENPSITDKEPRIWIAKDDMGLSEIEKNKAIENGVNVEDENTGFDEKGNIIYTAPPPYYEPTIRI